MNGAAALLFGLFGLSGCYVPERLSIQTMVPYPPFPDSVMVVLLAKADVRHIDGQKIGTVSYNPGDKYYPLTGARMANFTPEDGSSTRSQPGENNLRGPADTEI